MTNRNYQVLPFISRPLIVYIFQGREKNWEENLYHMKTRLLTPSVLTLSPSRRETDFLILLPGSYDVDCQWPSRDQHRRLLNMNLYLVVSSVTLVALFRVFSSVSRIRALRD